MKLTLLELGELQLAYENTQENSSNVKILLLGDDCQLPPRNSDTNNLFDFQWIQDNTLFKPFEDVKRLTISHRVTTGPLFDLSSSLRPLASANGEGIEAKKLLEILLIAKKFLDLVNKYVIQN